MSTTVSLSCTPHSSKLKYTWDFSGSIPTYSQIASMDLIVTDTKVSSESTSSIVYRTYNIDPVKVNPITEEKSLNTEFIVTDIPLGTTVSAVLSVTFTAGETITSQQTGPNTVAREPQKPIFEHKTTDNKIMVTPTNYTHISESDGHSQLTHMQLFYNDGTGIVSHPLIAIGASSEYLNIRHITGLTNNKEYEITGRVKNAIGWSQLSDPHVATPSNLPDNMGYLFANSSILRLNSSISLPDSSLNFTDSTDVDLQFPRSSDYTNLIDEKVPITSFTIKRHRLDASGNKILASLYSKTIDVDPSLNSIAADPLWVLDASRSMIKYTDVNVPVDINYVYGVIATNKFGSSSPTECKLSHVSLPSAPIINRVDPSNASVRINLSKPSLLNGFADVSATSFVYNVAVNEVSGNTLVYKGYTNSSVDASGNMTISSFNGGSLINGKQYEFNARLFVDISQNTFTAGAYPSGTVTFNGVRERYYGARSSPGVRSRPFTLPTAPTNLVCSPLDNSSNFVDPSSQPLDNKVWVKWNDVLASNNGGIDGDGVIKYKIYKNGLEAYTNIAKSPFLIDGNGNGTEFQVEVHSYVYNSELGKEIIGDTPTPVEVTPFKLPQEISNLILDASGAGVLRYSFSGLDMIQAGGLSVTYRRVLTDLSNNNTIGSATTSTSTSGKYENLTAGILYRLTVTPQVTSKRFSGDSSTRDFFGPSVSDTEVSYSTMNALTNLVLMPSDKTIRADWDKPSGITTDASRNIYSNGVRITGYRVQIATVTNGVVGTYTTLGTTDPNVETFIAGGLINGTTYSIRVFAVGVAGLNTVDGVTAEQESIPQVGPSAVTGLVAEPSSNSIKFTWNAQADNDFGYAGFAVYRDGEKINSSDFSANTVIRTGSKWSWTNTGLTNGTVYNYVFYAVKTVSGATVSSLISPATSINAAPYAGATVPRDVTYTTTSSTATVSWTAPSDLGGAGVVNGITNNSGLMYTLSLFDFSGNGTPTQNSADYIKLIEPVFETQNLTGTLSGLITNKTYRIVIGSYYTDSNGNKIYGAAVPLFPVKPNNPPLNVTIGPNDGAVATNNRVELKWTLPTDASDAAAYARDGVNIYRTITTGTGVVSARVLYATLPANATSFVDVSGGVVGGTFKATGSMNGNARLYTGLTDSSNLPAGTIINGNTYTYDIVFNVSTAGVVQPEPVTLTASPSGKVLVRTDLTQDSTNKKQFTIGLNKNGSDLADFLVVGLLPDGSGNLPLPVYQGSFADVPYTGSVPVTAGTQQTDNFAAKQFFDWTFTLDNVPSSLMVVVENGNGFTIRALNQPLSAINA